MRGILKDIIDQNIPANNGRPEIKKKIVTVEFENGESAAIEFTGELRILIIRGFKTGDSVDVDFKTKVHKNKRGKVFNNKTALAIKRL